MVSTLEPRKNAFFLLDWFRQSQALPAGSELWWVGPLGWLTSRRRLRQYQNAAGRKVRFLGVVSDAELCRLYRTAGWSAYPSLYEGFGFPVLDALRHGTPVLASYHSALVRTRSSRRPLLRSLRPGDRGRRLSRVRRRRSGRRASRSPRRPLQLERRRPRRARSVSRPARSRRDPQRPETSKNWTTKHTKITKKRHPTITHRMFSFFLLLLFLFFRAFSLFRGPLLL